MALEFTKDGRIKTIEDSIENDSIRTDSIKTYPSFAPARVGSSEIAHPKQARPKKTYPEKYVSLLHEGNKDMVDILGGKGANLAEMANLGLPVPPAFTLTTKAYHHYRNTGTLSSDVLEQIDDALGYIEELSARTFDGEKLLTLSVRSGAPVSMPGMMDTIINIGINSANIKNLVAESGEDYAFKAYNNLLETYSKTIFGRELPSLDEMMAYDNVVSSFIEEVPVMKDVLSTDFINYALSEVDKLHSKSHSWRVLEKLTKKELKSRISKLSKDSVSDMKESLVDIFKEYKSKFFEEVKDPKKIFSYLEKIQDGDENFDHVKVIGNSKRARDFYGESMDILGLEGTVNSVDSSDETIRLIFNRGKGKGKKTIDEWFDARYITMKSNIDIFDDLIESLSGEDCRSSASSYRLGDKIKMMHDYGPAKRGLTGTVVSKGSCKIGIEFDKPLDLGRASDLDGKTKPGHGLLVDSDYLQYLSPIDGFESMALRRYLEANPSEIFKFKKNALYEIFGKRFPEDVKEQLHSAIKAVFKSWDNDRARSYRRMNDIPGDIGTAATVQLMVYGNRNDKSLTGVFFTRNPVTGVRARYGEYLANAQGEDLVSGVKTPKLISAMAEQYPKIYSELDRYGDFLEKHYKDMQDIEFTVDDDTLYLLQTRNAKRTSLAKIKSSLDMISEGLIERDDLFKRINLSDIEAIRNEVYVVENPDYVKIGFGDKSAGVAIGRIALSSSHARTFNGNGEPAILVREYTDADDISGIKASVGILTANGGSTSHAAVVAKGMNKVCIPGCENITISDDHVIFDNGSGTIRLSEGDYISMDAKNGIIYKGKVETLSPKDNPLVTCLEGLILGSVDLDKSIIDITSEKDKSTLRDINGRKAVLNAQAVMVTATTHTALEKYVLDVKSDVTPSLKSGGLRSSWFRSGKESYSDSDVINAGILDIIADNYSCLFKGFSGDIYCNLIDSVDKILPSSEVVSEFSEFVSDNDKFFTKDYVKSCKGRAETIGSLTDSSVKFLHKEGYGLLLKNAQSLLMGAKKANADSDTDINLIINVPESLYAKNTRLVGRLRDDISSLAKTMGYDKDVKVIIGFEKSGMIYSSGNIIERIFDYKTKQVGA